MATQISGLTGRPSRPTNLSRPLSLVRSPTTGTFELPEEQVGEPGINPVRPGLGRRGESDVGTGFSDPSISTGPFGGRRGEFQEFGALDTLGRDPNSFLSRYAREISNPTSIGKTALSAFLGGPASVLTGLAFPAARVAGQMALERFGPQPERPETVLTGEIGDFGEVGDVGRPPVLPEGVAGAQNGREPADISSGIQDVIGGPEERGFSSIDDFGELGDFGDEDDGFF